MGKYSKRKANKIEPDIGDNAGGIAVVLVSIVCLVVIIAIAMSIKNFMDTSKSINNEISTTASLEKTYKSIKPQTSVSKAAKLDLEGTEKKLTANYTKLVTYLYGGLKSSDDFTKNQEEIEKWFSPAGVEKLKTETLFESQGKTKPVATKNESIYVTFGSINYVDSIVKVTIYTTYKADKDAFDSGEGQALITFWYDIENKMPSNLKVRSSQIKGGENS